MKRDTGLDVSKPLPMLHGKPFARAGDCRNSDKQKFVNQERYSNIVQQLPLPNNSDLPIRKMRTDLSPNSNRQ